MPRSRVYLQVNRVDAAVCAAARAVSVEKWARVVKASGARID